MNVHPATKNGYLLKKLSIEIRIDSKSIFPVDGSETEVKDSDARTEEGKIIWEAVTERWVLVRSCSEDDKLRNFGEMLSDVMRV